jgi:hypothetical protein
MVVTIHYLSIYTSQQDVATKGNGRIINRRRCWSLRVGSQQA